MTKKTDDLPRISIIIPSYNKVDYIRTTLQSIINQKYPNLEVIIQDGKSTDGTVDIIKEFARKYPKIFKWVSEKDGGQVDAINSGLGKATGEILAYINADDVCCKGALLEVGKCFKKNLHCLWVTGYGDIIDRQGKTISSWVTRYKNLLLGFNNFQTLLVVNFITQPSTFISREAYQKYGSFIGTKKYVMEYDMWLKLGQVKMPQVIRKNLSSFRLTVDNISSTSSRELLGIDYKLAQNYTKNSILLLLHNLHNLGRIGIINIIKAK